MPPFVLSEFELISRYFTHPIRQARKDVILSVGDDCAITQIHPNQRLVITTDTLVAGQHFFPNIAPQDLAYKTLACNLSDLAAMGAKPAWVSLALTLPQIDHVWLKAFSQRFFEVLDHYNVELIGGDTTKGPLTLTITAHGLIPKDKVLRRNQAKPGDWIYVSGYLGDSAAGLALLTQQQTVHNEAQHYLIRRHLQPTPRVLLGLTLINYANACIDISDGLLGDLGHILKQSHCGAKIHLERLPLSLPLLQEYSLEQAENYALTGGEDYELCFTVSEENHQKLQKELKHLNVACHCIGQICVNKQHKITLFRNGVVSPLPPIMGFDHFKHE